MRDGTPRAMQTTCPRQDGHARGERCRLRPSLPTYRGMDHADGRRRGRARLAVVLALIGCASLTGACLRPNAQADDRNPNGPGSTGRMPHNTSGPSVKNTGGAGYYGGESWAAAGPGYGFGGAGSEEQGSTINSTDEPGSTGAAPGSGNNGWGGAASPSRGVTGNGVGPWTQ